MAAINQVVVRHVAGLIVENGLTRDAAERINSGEGWTFEAGIGDRNAYTRFAAYEMNDDEMIAAWELAEERRQGKWRPEDF